jgi:hypothetical protein
VKRTIAAIILMLPIATHAEPPSENVLFLYGAQPVQTLAHQCRFAARGLYGAEVPNGEFSLAVMCTSYLRGVIDAWMIATGRLHPWSYETPKNGKRYNNELFFCIRDGESYSKNQERAQRELNLLVRHLTLWVAEGNPNRLQSEVHKKGFYSATEALLVELERNAPCPARKNVPLEDRGEKTKKP